MEIKLLFNDSTLTRRKVEVSMMEIKTAPKFQTSLIGENIFAEGNN